MKCTIINCDMCGGRIYTGGCFEFEKGAISIPVKTLIGFSDIGSSCWKKQKYHICPKCVEKLKEYCKSGVVNNDAG